MASTLSEIRSRFVSIDRQARSLIERCPTELLFEKPRALNNSLAPFSVGEFAIRAVGKTEQAFGGITTRLWDDPFEWTLPESFRERSAIILYFDEVCTTVLNGFEFISNDEALVAVIPAPVKFKTIDAVLNDAAIEANRLLGKAEALWQFHTGDPAFDVRNG